MTDLRKLIEEYGAELAKTTCDFVVREEKNVTGKNGKLSGIQAYEWECQAAHKDGFKAAVELLWPVVEASINEANSSRAGVHAFRQTLNSIEKKVGKGE